MESRPLGPPPKWKQKEHPLLVWRQQTKDLRKVFLSLLLSLWKKIT